MEPWRTSCKGLAEEKSGVHDESGKGTDSLQVFIGCLLLSVCLLGVRSSRPWGQSGAAMSHVHDQDQRQVQLTSSPCSCPQGTDFLVPLGHVTSPSWALVWEAALGLNS